MDTIQKNRHTRLWFRLVFVIAFLLLRPISAIYAAPVSFSGNILRPIEIGPEKSTGLDAIFVLYDLNNVAVSYEAQSSASDVKWYRYSNLGGGYAEELSGIVRSGKTLTLSQPQGDMGYIIEENSRRYCFWLVNYQPHRLKISSIEPALEQDCSMTNLDIIGSGEEVKYFTITGQQRILDQKIEIRYNTLEWNDESKTWNQTESIHNLESFKNSVHIMPAPLCNTPFSIDGDRFLKEWNLVEHAESQTFHTNAVDSRTEAVQIKSENDKSNQINSGEDSGLGGSAPADITFYAYVTDAVIHNEWQMSRDPEFEDIEYRFSEQDLNYVFREEGTFYVRYIGSNSDGSCETYSDTYTIGIGASEIKCPNAFSPGASEGINDEWKISYRSIISFKCWIFNRYGVEMCHFEDPEAGWDGRYGGKLVKPGVYYYVIEAEGADGKKYKLSGDINILNYTGTGKSDSGNETAP